MKKHNPTRPMAKVPGSGIAVMVRRGREEDALKLRESNR